MMATAVRLEVTLCKILMAVVIAPFVFPIIAPSNTASIQMSFPYPHSHPLFNLEQLIGRSQQSLIHHSHNSHLSGSNPCVLTGSFCTDASGTLKRTSLDANFPTEPTLQWARFFRCCLTPLAGQPHVAGISSAVQGEPGNRRLHLGCFQGGEKKVSNNLLCDLPGCLAWMSPRNLKKPEGVLGWVVRCTSCLSASKKM